MSQQPTVQQGQPIRAEDINAISSAMARMRPEGDVTETSTGTLIHSRRGAHTPTLRFPNPFDLDEESDDVYIGIVTGASSPSINGVPIDIYDRTRTEKLGSGTAYVAELSAGSAFPVGSAMVIHGSMIAVTAEDDE